ncbi:MAG: hypothetical protein FRX48_06409 [Lasallia pustulata]|uniref:Uncharacterized protein n=1 Tax=Lasallia pustulata TaxID=136370 RepID=A0A5M8PK60_9LECA|nr:MAG: hypothetical protein FRX48_06409 [Lasallia pustulata]
MSQPWDYIAKLVCIGDSGTGKSSLTIRLCEGRFSPHHDVTIGVEFGSRIVPVGPPASLSLSINNPSSPPPRPHQPRHTAPPQKRMKLSLWDTAGQETYKSITRSYFRGASGALLVYDITRRGTFVSATAWLHDLRALADANIVVVLVGNKRDLAAASAVEPAPAPQQEDGTGGGAHAAADPGNRRAVTREEAEDWCRRNGVLQYVETSAKSGEGVERAFLEVAERIYQNIEAGRYDLNDRRSGVKGPGAGGGGAGAGRGGANGAVVLGMNDVVGKTGAGGGGCC